jgi:uncharacterized protein
MKSLHFILLFIAINISTVSLAQTIVPANTFPVATANSKEYKALYVLNESGDKKIRAVIRNINNALEDPRLKGKLQVELVAFGDGVELYKKTNGYDTLLTALHNKGVLFVQCENTLRERKVSKEELWPFVSYVPSGTGEMILRQYEGWAIVHP